MQFFCLLVSFHFDVLLSSDYSLGFSFPALICGSRPSSYDFPSPRNFVQTRLKMDFNVFLYITFRCLMTLTFCLMSCAFWILCDAFRSIISSFLGFFGGFFTLYLKFQVVKSLWTNYFNCNYVTCIYCLGVDGQVFNIFGDVDGLWRFLVSPPSFSWFHQSDATFLPVLVLSVLLHHSHIKCIWIESSVVDLFWFNSQNFSQSISIWCILL